jgi:biopolymer transport protein ExbD
MAFGTLSSGAARPMGDINMTPLVDVMLVLLVIFIVTAPLITQGVKVELPRTAPVAAPPPETEAIRLALDGEGQLFWNETPVASIAEAEAKLAAEAAAHPDTEVRLSADRDTRYETIAQLMAAARRAGVEKLGFVSVLADGDGLRQAN